MLEDTAPVPQDQLRASYGGGAGPETPEQWSSSEVHGLLVILCPFLIVARLISPRRCGSCPLLDSRVEGTCPQLAGGK